ncbi:hypothetical protein C5D66_16120, partial [Rathayibacter sp. AY1B4]
MPSVYERPPPQWLRASGSGGLLIESPSLLLTEPSAERTHRDPQPPSTRIPAARSSPEAALRGGVPRRRGDARDAGPGRVRDPPARRGG